MIKIFSRSVPIQGCIANYFLIGWWVYVTCWPGFSLFSQYWVIQVISWQGMVQQALAISLGLIWPVRNRIFTDLRLQDHPIIGKCDLRKDSKDYLRNWTVEHWIGCVAEYHMLQCWPQVGEQWFVVRSSSGVALLHMFSDYILPLYLLSLISGLIMVELTLLVMCFFTGSLS